MSTFAKSFKDEVTRLARKEAKAAVAPIRKPSGTTRSALADLKRRVAALEKDNRRLFSLTGALTNRLTGAPSPLRLSASAGQLSPPTAYSPQPSASASRKKPMGSALANCYSPLASRFLSMIANREAKSASVSSRVASAFRR